jgi:hypothetical protein
MQLAGDHFQKKIISREISNLLSSCSVPRPALRYL